MATTIQSIFSTGFEFTQNFLAGRLFKRFGKYLPGPAKIMFLLQKTYAKQGEEAGIEHIANDLFEKTKLLGQFITAFFKNEYREIEPLKATMIIAALAYIVSPIDLIPDAIPVIGLMDDLFIMAWLFENLNEELEKFKIWIEANESYEAGKA